MARKIIIGKVPFSAVNGHFLQGILSCKVKLL